MKVGGSQIPPTFQFEVIKMIDENLTMAFFGYHSFDLSYGSSKRIIVICDNCGITKTTLKKRSDLPCYKCGHTRKHTKEEKRKISVSNKGRIHSKEATEKNRIAHLKENLSKETREKMSTSSMGVKNPNWLNGISGEIYPQKFNRSLKRAVRELYNNYDFFSGLHKNIINSNKELSVHHIDYNKDNCNLNNFVPLCKIHHNYTNKNRWFWKKLIKNTQEIDRWYYEH